MYRLCQTHKEEGAWFWEDLDKAYSLVKGVVKPADHNELLLIMDGEPFETGLQPEEQAIFIQGLEQLGYTLRVATIRF